MAVRPFRSYEPALDQFPVDVWARVASRRLRRITPSLLESGDSRGYRPLREAIAGYLGASRGVRCTPEQVIVITGVQAGLHLLAQLLCQPGDAVVVEDPVYPGALMAFENARAKVIPVPVDAHGIDVSLLNRLAMSPKAVYVTPAHQCPLGVTMSLDRRLALLDWARRTGAFIFEDDYDSEYRYSGRPVPALQGLDQGESVIFLGTFNKVLFPSLRIGYMVVPLRLAKPLARQRAYFDRYGNSLDQAILCDFMTEGHLGRHIRRMRNVYAARLGALTSAVEHYLKGLLELPAVEAGLCTPAMLPGEVDALAAQSAAAELDLEAVALERLCRKRTDIHGLLLGFAAFNEGEIRRAVARLAGALERLPGVRRARPPVRALV